MLNIETFDTSSNKFYEAALEIRRDVFIAGQNVDPELEIEKEDKCIHYLLLLNDQPIGTARWRATENGIKLVRCSILGTYRNKGYGTVILKKVLQDILSRGQKIYLHSQLQVVPYYQRQGFINTGDVSQEAGIDHYYMVKEPN